MFCCHNPHPYTFRGASVWVIGQFAPLRILKGVHRFTVWQASIKMVHPYRYSIHTLRSVNKITPSWEQFLSYTITCRACPQLLKGKHFVHVGGGEQPQVRWTKLHSELRNIMRIKSSGKFINVGTIKPRCKEHLLWNRLLFSSSYTALMENAQTTHFHTALHLAWKL